MNKFIPLLFLVLFIFSCGRKVKQENPDSKSNSEENTTEQNSNADWEEIRQSVITFDSYDGNRILESGQGFFIAGNIFVTTYSLVSSANKIVFSPLNENVKYTADKFVAVDRINDLILIYCDSLNKQPIKLFKGTVPNSAKTSYINPSSGKIIQLFSGKLLNLATVKGTKLYRITNRVRKSNFGMPVFVSTKEAIGVAFSAVESYEMQSFAIPSFFISQLLENQKSPASLESLRSNTSETIAAENRKIKGLVLETDEGNITIRLFNETSEYRDNFIKLTKEHFFDSLLIHRVIKNFGIQSGAADTRYAEKGDIVGYKGPGYTIPAHIVPGLYHKRGMIGSPRKPDTKNERLRSDGSQFYIISGRKYTDKELDELEKENNYKFSATQRQAYKTVGGAPHLDGSYTVFGEVVSGMDVVDKIVQVKTDDDWRPLDDIRLKKVTILK